MTDLPRLPLTSILPRPGMLTDLSTKEWAGKLNTFLDDYMRRVARKVNQITYEIEQGAVMKADYNANTILYATTDDTPVALTVAASRVIGRKATGNISAMTAAETRTVLGLDTDDAVTFGSVSAGAITGTTVKLMSGEEFGLILDVDNVEHTAERTLTFDVSNADRTLAIHVDVTLNQSVSTTSSPIFVSPTVSGLTFNFATQDYLFTNRDGSFLALQSQTSNLNPTFEIFTKDGDRVADEAVYLHLWGMGTPTNITNREIFTFGTTHLSGLIYTSAAGEGDVLPISIYTGANTTQLVLATNNSISMSGALGVTGTVTGGSLVIGTDSLVVDVVNDRVGIGTSSPDSVFHIKAGTPGTIGSHPAGQLIIQNPTNSVFACAVITGYESDGDGNPDQQLWYLGSSSSSNSDIIFLNRRNSKLALGTNGSHRITILGNGNIGINETAPQDKLEVNGTGLFKDKLKFTQDDGNEYIDSLADGYMDYGATTGHRFNADLLISGTNELNFRDTDISIGSTLFDGILDMSADISIDMFYDNADVGDGVDGQSLNINRRAAEGDSYISLYVDKDRKGLIGFSGDDDLLQLAANALTVNGAVTTGGDINIGSSGAGDRNLYVHSDTAGKFIRLKALGNYSGLEAATLLTITSTGYVQLQSGTGQHQYFDCGGTFSFRDQDDSDAVKVTIASATGVINTVGNYEVDGVQVVTNRVIDARCDDAVNSGDATTDGVIDALRDAMITHGLVAAA